MESKLLILSLFFASILGCAENNSQSGFTYKFFDVEHVETTRPISPSDSIANVECIPISIQNNSNDSLVLYHDKAKILTQERIEAFSTKQNDCGYVSVVDGIANDQTTLLKQELILIRWKFELNNSLL